MTQCYLRIEGIEGGCTDPAHVGEIEVLSYSDGIANSIKAHASSTSQAHFQDFHITKYVDLASPRLSQACAEGTRIQEILFRQYVGDRKLLEYRFGGCVITSVSRSGTYSEGRPIETMSFGYAKVEWVYTHPDEADNAAPVSAGSVVTPPPESTVLHSQTEPLRSYIPKTAFIIMWMDPARPELDDVCNALKEVCQSFGIRALRADDVQHEDRITNLILEKIAKSEFLVADLSGERPNVYYEVGYAHALGKLPILYKKRGTQLHFDLSMHNVREYSNITQLKELLGKRLENQRLARRPHPAVGG